MDTPDLVIKSQDDLVLAISDLKEGDTVSAVTKSGDIISVERLGNIEIEDGYDSLPYIELIMYVGVEHSRRPVDTETAYMTLGISARDLVQNNSTLFDPLLYGDTQWEVNRLETNPGVY
jgi:hypothetical protein